MGPNVQRSMIGLATTRRTMSSAVAGSMARPNSTRRPVAATFTGTPSWAAACIRAAAAPSVTPAR